MSSRTHQRRGFAAGALALLLSFDLIGCAREAEPMPSQLLGRWVADAPQYADRILDVRSELVAFGTGLYSQDFYSVVGVETLPPEDGWTTYRISVREEDSAISELELAFRDGSPRELRFRNHAEIWRPEGSIAAPAAPETPKKAYRVDGWMTRERSDG